MLVGYAAAAAPAAVAAPIFFLLLLLPLLVVVLALATAWSRRRACCLVDLVDRGSDVRIICRQCLAARGRTMHVVMFGPGRGRPGPYIEGRPAHDRTSHAIESECLRRHYRELPCARA